MSMVYVEFRLDHPIFRETVGRVPAVELEWVRNVPSAEGSTVLVWAPVDDEEAFREAAEADPTVAEISQTIAVGERHLCQVELSEEGRDVDLYPILLETGSVVSDATVAPDGWECHFGFADSSALSRFFETAEELGIEYAIERVYEPRSVDGPEEVLTAAQRSALLTALDVGYFDVPRASDLETVGNDLGISDTAASERIRRGVRSLVSTVVADDIP